MKNRIDVTTKSNDPFVFIGISKQYFRKQRRTPNANPKEKPRFLSGFLFSLDDIRNTGELYVFSIPMELVDIRYLRKVLNCKNSSKVNFKNADI